MKSPTLALTVRSLRVDARSLSPYVVRSTLVVVMIFTVWTTRMTGVFYGAPGLQLFSSIAWINLVFITILGISTFASVIAEEKEDQTLGLLKMTALNPISILLGKSASRLMTGIMLLAAQLPFAMLAITLGGVSLRQVLAVYLLLAAFMLFIFGVSLVFSVVCGRSGTAAGATVLFLTMLYMLPMLFRGVLELLVNNGVMGETHELVKSADAVLGFLGTTSIPAALQRVLSTGFSGPLFGLSVQVHVGAAVVLFGIAWLLFNRCTRREASTAPSRPKLIGKGGRSRSSRAGRAWRRAVMWKEFHFSAGGWRGILLRYVVMACLIVLIALTMMEFDFKHGLDVEMLGGVVVWIMLVTLLVEAGIHAGRLFREELREKTWPALMTMSLLIGQIAYAKVLGSLPMLIPAATFALLGLLLIKPSDQLEFFTDILPEPGFWYAVAMLIFAVHLVCYLSLWFRRGAFAITLVAMFMFTSFLGVMMQMLLMVWQFAGGSVDELIYQVLFGGMALTFFVLSLLLHPMIGARLRKLAAE